MREICVRCGAAHLPRGHHPGVLGWCSFSTNQPSPQALHFTFRPPGNRSSVDTILLAMCERSRKPLGALAAQGHR